MVPRGCSVVLLDFPIPGLSDCIISPGRFRYWRRNSPKADSGSGAQSASRNFYTDRSVPHNLVRHGACI
jgi:hypothetical protein